MKDGAMWKAFWRRPVLAALLALLGTSAAWGSWGYNAPLTFSGYGASETLTNFPALVVLSNNCFSGFKYSQFQSGSNDLAFTDSTGLTNLNYEIESWNPGGASYVWVQVPALTNNAGITAWWGAAGQSVPACTTNGSTWSNGYAAVWHMNQATLIRDSTTNHFDGTSSTVTLTNGVTGNALHFNSASVLLTNTFSVTGGRFTLEILGQTTSSAIANPFDSQSGRLITRWNEPGAGQTTYYDGSDHPSSGCGANLNNGSWQYLAYVLNQPANAGLVYQAGVNVGGGSLSTSTLGGQTRIGTRYDGGSYYFQGNLDEMRVSATLRSSNWVWAVYQNMVSNSAFQSYGEVVNLGGAPKIQNVAATNVTQTSACLNGLLKTNGTSAATVTLYWGPTDGTNNVTAWSNTVSFGVNAQPTPTSYTTNLTGLTSGTTYYYCYYAANDAGSTWASPSSLSFTTPSLPTVTNNGTSSVGGRIATLNGTVSGVPAPSVYVCWGTTDGGTSTSAWQNVMALGTQSGAFSALLSGLALNTAYCYRCCAVNSAGAVWTSTAPSFTTWNYAWLYVSGSWPKITDGDWCLNVSGTTALTITSVATNGQRGLVDLTTPISNGGTVTAFGYQSFLSTTLTDLRLPSNLQSIGPNCFGCPSLTNVVPLLPGGVTYIGYYAFSGCPIVGDLVITNAGPVTIDGGYQFRSTKISSVTLGKGVTNISLYMFDGCANLQRAYFCGYPTFGSTVFGGATNYQMRMYIPRDDTNWAAFAATGVVALTSIETNRFQANYPGEALPLGTWRPSGAGTEWYCLWTALQNQHRGTVIYLW